ncbi:4-(cytidine 5'-diphospho)-2-C-methyl-D-erythritol kinase [Parasphingopyxis sp.]|uniref:4-(cytidine 5'-diphospho)-2-C-methyl-D-erythritol kinase n=1 Tax=Parasphingopyxis sp. TaxID=1920299 RepID=UPI002626AE1D|nr:4-(cytidine 5'-diphospho)-2-C-methyl-D-erythritol kinase [Parasphingopyxis sp.]
MADHSAALRETAYAKINLALHVRERMPDGYHRIETLFAFCADGDVLRAEAATDLTLTIDGPFGDALSNGPENLVLRAADALRKAVHIETGAALHLTKNLPLASGVGGGSGDAAAALRILKRLWDPKNDAGALHQIAADLGADVPACLLSRPCFGAGRGDALTPVAPGNLAGTPILLVNPGVPVETGPVFAAWNGEDGGALDMTDPLRLDTDWRNDLAAPARAIAPAIDKVMAVLEAASGAYFVRMSGSGATCFALFDTAGDRDAAAAAIARDNPEWWTMRSALR